MPEAPSRGLPGRELVRLPAPAVGGIRVSRVGASAQLDPPGLIGAGKAGNRVGPGAVGAGMAPHVTVRAVHMPDMSWTAEFVTCDPSEMSVTDPLLVVRRHVDLLRVRSAICRDTR